ncbi:MAG: electron transfer flavoprotein subunit beta/FixA family protein [Planctomycetes bacterium]|nr:electron transfer flavoprotein subunit beta/FixA family protein [Planctomycetota bacterium]
MSFHIVVLAKQVPDTHNIKGDAMKEDGTVNRQALPAVFNPEDLHALEAALVVKERYVGSKVSVLCMGPPAAEQVLKESLYRGVDFVALISDRKFAGADTLATSYALKCAIEKLGAYDLVFCGRQAIDGDTAQVGPQTAEKLGINQITYVNDLRSLDPLTREVVARRSIEGGYEVVKAKMPLLLTFTDEAYSPRPPSAKKLLSYRKVTARAVNESYDESYIEVGDSAAEIAIQIWDIKTIGADPEQCGLAGSPTKVKKIQSVVLTSASTRMIDGSDGAIAEMIAELHNDHTLG